MSRELTGRRVLVVEDQYFIADHLSAILSEAGAEVVGPYRTAEQALSELDADLSFALLDINLGDSDGYAVAHELRRRGMPFAFVTGYSHATLPPEFQTTPYIGKPFSPEKVIRTVERGS